MSSLTPLAHHIVRATLAESVYEVLLGAILSGRLQSGAELSAVKLAQELEVSRTPVHEAIRQLARDGLVEQSANRKARVARFTRRDVYEVFEMRRILEPAAAQRAAQRIEPQALDALRTVARSLAASPGNAGWSEQWIDFDEQFHATIARASGLPRLAEDIGRYRLLHRGLNLTFTVPDSLQQALAEHVAILDALEARSSQAAREAMDAHIAAWQRYFVEHFPR